MIMEDISSPAPTSTQPPLPQPLLHLNKSIIRPFHPSDASSISLAANTQNISKWLRGTLPYPYGTPAVDLGLSRANGTKDWAVVALDNVTIMGRVSLKSFSDIHHRNASLGYWLGEKYWGQGIMSEVLKAICAWAFETQPKLLRIQAEVIDGNLGSVKVLENAGFVLECCRRMAVEKHGVVYDELCYVLFRE